MNLLCVLFVVLLCLLLIVCGGMFFMFDIIVGKSVVDVISGVGQMVKEVMDDVCKDIIQGNIKILVDKQLCVEIMLDGWLLIGGKEVVVNEIQCC